MTVTRAFTVAFEGLEARTVDVQVHIAGGLPAFAIVGLPDKAVAESKERVRAALAAMGALPTGEIERYVALGELALDGALTPVSGVLPAAVAALGQGRGIICS